MLFVHGSANFHSDVAGVVRPGSSSMSKRRMEAEAAQAAHDAHSDVAVAAAPPRRDAPQHELELVLAVAGVDQGRAQAPH